MSITINKPNSVLQQTGGAGEDLVRRGGGHHDEVEVLRGDPGGLQGGRVARRELPVLELAEVEPFGAQPQATHHTLLGAGILILVTLAAAAHSPPRS